MKFRYRLLLLCLIAFTAASFTYQTDKIAGLLRLGDAHGLARLFAADVELTILNGESIYAKAPAEAALQKFFNDNRPSAVKMLHHINSNPNYNFEVFILNTGKGVFRISCTFKKAGGNLTITELRIETEKVK